MNAPTCAHCGKPLKGFAILADGSPVCHTGTIPPRRQPVDCYRLVTVYGEVLGSRRKSVEPAQG